MKYARLVEEAKRDPSRIYSNVSDVLRDRRLSDAERLEILKSWERDASALNLAADDAMGSGEAGRLQEVIAARQEVETRIHGKARHHRENANHGGDQSDDDEKR